MDRMGSPRGLIRYTTEHALHGGDTRIARPRILVYAGLLLVVSCVLVYSMFTRTPLILDVLRDRNALFREIHGEVIENSYTLKLINLDEHAHEYRLEVSGLDGAVLVTPVGTVDAAPGSVNNFAARVQA